MVKYCPKCGTPNDDDANFCIKCGYRFPTQAPEISGATKEEIPKSPVQGKPQEEKAAPQASPGVTESPITNPSIGSTINSTPSPSVPPSVNPPKSQPSSSSANPPSKPSSGKGLKIIAITLVILLIAVSGAMAYYTSSLQSQLNADNSEISSLNSQLNADNSTVSSLQSQLSSANGQVSSLQSQLLSDSNEISSLESQVSNLQSQLSSASSSSSSLQSQLSSYEAIANLQDSSTLTYDQTVNQPAGSYTYWTFSLSYPGYLLVDVLSSTTSNTYVTVSYSYGGSNITFTNNVGSSGMVLVPVLPSSAVVEVGNTNFINGATETVTITYYY